MALILNWSDTVLQKFPSPIAYAISDHSSNRSLSSQKGERSQRKVAAARVLDVRLAYYCSIREKKFMLHVGHNVNVLVISVRYWGCGMCTQTMRNPLKYILWTHRL